MSSPSGPGQPSNSNQIVYLNSFTCRACQLVSNSIVAHQQHLETSTKCANKIRGLELIESTEQVNERLLRKYKHCSTCSREGVLNEHVSRERPAAGPVPLNSPKSSEQTGCFKCEQCSFRSKMKRRLDEHVRFRHGFNKQVQPFKCQRCPLKFQSAAELQSHFALEACDSVCVRWFACQHCPLECKTSGNLGRHGVQNHAEDEDIKWFQCDHCSFRSKIEDGLRDHVVREHGAQDVGEWFRCEQCSFKSKTSGFLDRHVQSKHGVKK